MVSYEVGYLLSPVSDLADLVSKQQNSVHVLTLPVVHAMYKGC